MNPVELGTFSTGKKRQILRALRIHKKSASTHIATCVVRILTSTAKQTTAPHRAPDYLQFSASSSLALLIFVAVFISFIARFCLLLLSIVCLSLVVLPRVVSCLRFVARPLLVFDVEKIRRSLVPALLLLLCSETATLLYLPCFCCCVLLA